MSAKRPPIWQSRRAQAFGAALVAIQATAALPLSTGVAITTIASIAAVAVSFIVGDTVRKSCLSPEDQLDEWERKDEHSA